MSEVSKILNELISLGVLRAEDPRLCQRAKEVSFSDDNVILLEKQLRHVMIGVCKLYTFTRGFGLAAPQIGIPRRAFVFGFMEGEIHFAANPQILEMSHDVMTAFEGCLSSWEWRGQVSRPTGIVMQYRNASGDEVTIRESGERARLLLHEVDHLNGILYNDKMQSEDILMPLDEYLARNMSLSQIIPNQGKSLPVSGDSPKLKC